jgi:hypothetical protein
MHGPRRSRVREPAAVSIIAPILGPYSYPWEPFIPDGSPYLGQAYSRGTRPPQQRSPPNRRVS